MAFKDTALGRIDASVEAFKGNVASASFYLHPEEFAEAKQQAVDMIDLDPDGAFRFEQMAETQVHVYPA